MKSKSEKLTEIGKVTAIIDNVGEPECFLKPSYFKLPTVFTAVSTSGLIAASVEFVREELISRNSEASKILAIFMEVKDIPDEYSKIVKAYELFEKRNVSSFSFHKKKSTRGCASTPGNGLCGYLIIHQLRQRHIQMTKKKKGFKFIDDVKSLDVNKPVDRIIFLQILRDYALSTSNSQCRSTCERVHEEICGYFKPGMNIPFYLPESSDLWWNALWLPSLSLDFDRALFVCDLSANLPPNFSTLIQKNDNNDCLLNLSIGDIMSTIEKNNYFVLESKHFSLLPTPVVCDEIDDAKEAIFLAIKNMFTALALVPSDMYMPIKDEIAVASIHAQVHTLERKKKKKIISSSYNLRSKDTSQLPQTNVDEGCSVRDFELAIPTNEEVIQSGSQKSLLPCAPQSIDENSKITQIPLCDLGSLVNTTHSIKFIPDKYVKSVRKIYNKHMELVIGNPNIEENWLKFFLLPIVLFTFDAASHWKKTLNGRIQLLLEGRWSEITLGMVSKRIVYNRKKSIKYDEKYDRYIQRKVEELGKAGEIGSIMDLLSRDSMTQLSEDEVITLLEKKHPPRTADPTHIGDLPVPTSHSVNKFDYKIPQDKIRKIILTRKKLVCHGVDKLRYDHLQDLIGYGRLENDDEIKFADSLSEIISLILSCNAPDSVYTFLRDTELIAVPKGNLDIRPIGMGSVIRKICSICAVQLAEDRYKSTNPQSFSKSHFSELQFGLDKKGNETIVHTFRLFQNISPEKDVFAMDGDNAFNRIRRHIGLSEIYQHLPVLYPFMYKMYGHNSRGWYYSSDGAVRNFISQEGFHQGDVLASLMYCTTIQPFVRGLKDILGDGNIVQFFIDDGNLGADFDKMLLAINYVKENGPQYGYHLKLSKGCYLLGKCGYEESERRKQCLVDLGLSIDIIKQHPDDTKNHQETLYGAKILGTFIGSEGFIRNSLLEMADTLKNVAKKIEKVGNKQIRQLLLRWCFCQKIIYLQRTTPPNIMNSSLVPRYDCMKKGILASILGKKTSTISDLCWEQACLPIQSSGFGLHFSYDTSHVAYVASLYEYSTQFDRIFKMSFGTLIQSATTYDTISTMKNSILYLNQLNEEINMEYIVKLLNERPNVALQHFLGDLIKRSRERNFKEKIKDNNYLSWVTSQNDKYAGIWLDMCPKTPYHTMSNVEFEIACNWRLYLDQNLVIPGTRCNCRKSNSPFLDNKGIHLCTGCSMSGTRIQMHNGLRDTFNYMLRHCGLYTVLEEKDVFKSVDPHNNKRMDISVINLPDHDKKLLLDIGVTSPVPSTSNNVLSKTKASVKLRAAEDRYKAKMNYYQNDARLNDLSCLPVIFEVTGAIHNDTIKLIEKVAERKAQNDNMLPSNVARYWISCLIFKLFISIAKCIVKRTSQIYSYTVKSSHYNSNKTMSTLSYCRGSGTSFPDTSC